MHPPELRPSSPPPLHAGEQAERGWVRTVVFLVLTGLGLLLCYALARPFLSAFTWALALAVLFSPLQGWLERKWGRANLAAAFSLTLIALVVVLASSFLCQRLYAEVAKGAAIIEAKVSSGEWQRAVAAQPFLARAMDRIAPQVDFPGAMRSLAAWLSAGAGRVLRGSVVQLVGLGITFYLLFFFLRDRRLILDGLRWLSPLATGETDRILTRVEDTVCATVYGSLAVSAVQGLLGGLMFWWLGLPSPLFWGVVMALLSVVPLLGAFIVWLPGAAFLAAEGSWGRALILVGWGLLVVGTVDNLLRPLLVGNRLQLHTVLVFMAVVGGLVLFGPAGLVLGPLTVTVTITLLEIWSDRNAALSARPSS